MHNTRDIIESFQHHIQRHLEAAPAGIGILAAYFGGHAIAAGQWVLAPKSILALVVLLLLADLATGIIKANLLPGITVNSATGFGGMVKIFINIAAVWLLMQVSDAAPMLGAVIQVLMGAPIYNELISILENLDAIDDHYGGKSKWIKPVCKALNVIKERALEAVAMPFAADALLSIPNQPSTEQATEEKEAQDA